jgi:hypothetical protein
MSASRPHPRSLQRCAGLRSARSSAIHEQPKFGTMRHQITWAENQSMEIDLLLLEIVVAEGFLWLGGRDSNPDNVVQRAVHGLPYASVRSVLGRFARDASGPLRSISVRSRAACLIVSHPPLAISDRLSSDRGLRTDRAHSPSSCTALRTRSHCSGVHGAFPLCSSIWYRTLRSFGYTTSTKGSHCTAFQDHLPSPLSLSRASLPSCQATGSFDPRPTLKLTPSD